MKEVIAVTGNNKGKGKKRTMLRPPRGNDWPKPVVSPFPLAGGESGRALAADRWDERERERQ